MRTRIKICCMVSLEEVQLAIRTGADAVGFVGPMPTGSHAISDDLAANLAAHISATESAKLAELLPATRRAQVIHVTDERALDLIECYAPYVHAFLLDSGRPHLAVPEFGGTGRTHDWQVSAEFVRRSPHPVFLAGGLTAANVREAIRRVHPFGVDLCSGVRTDGRLDPTKLDAFIDAVRQGDLHVV